MPPAVIPTPLPNWAKWIVKLTPYPDTFLNELVDYFDDNSDPSQMEWRRLMIRFANVASSDPRDDCWCTFDLANVTAGSLDTSWTTTDYTTVESAFDTWITTIKVYLTTNYIVDQYKWYRRAFRPYTEVKPFAEVGGPVRVTSKTISMTGSGSQAPQVAMSVTEKTAWAHHWGRFYLPGPAQSVMTTGGTFVVANITSIINATQTLYAALGTAELYPCVPVTQVDKSPARALLGVQSLQIDDVPDVIRRRRPYSAANRIVRP